MKRAVKLLTVLDILFILLLSLSGSVSGIIRDVLYLLAFWLPLIIGVRVSVKLKREREERAGLAEREPVGIGLSREGIKTFLPLIAPTVALVFVAALLTSMLLGLLGYTPSTVPDQPFAVQLLVHALAPAILEELLFRYLPIKLLYGYSPRGCVFISALYFALIHLDLFKMPYAFLAGVLFVMIDLACGSILPSLIIHFVNNAASLATMKFGHIPNFLTVFYISFGVLASVSLVFIIIRRRKYLCAVKDVLRRGELSYDYSPVMLSLLCVGVALINLIA